VVSRLGGDEFTVLLPGIKNPMDSTIVSQKILTTVSAPYTLQGHTSNVTTSIGISVYPIDGDNAVELIKLADIAMYESKRSGRNKHSMTDKLANLG
jgi:diguanylate cyclase (GGDEF)-like protein